MIPKTLMEDLRPVFLVTEGHRLLVDQSPNWPTTHVSLNPMRMHYQWIFLLFFFFFFLFSLPMNSRISRKKKDCFSLLPCTVHYGTLLSLLFLNKHKQSQHKGIFEWKHKQIYEQNEMLIAQDVEFEFTTFS
jgi:hypothetical protein